MSRPHLSLPPELLARIEGIRTHTTLPQQTNSLSLDHPTGYGKQRYRWFLPFIGMPYLHLIHSTGHGSDLKLQVLVPHVGKVITLSRESESWKLVSVSVYRNGDEYIPNRYKHTNRRWFRKPATKAQIRMVAEIMAIKIDSIPPLTAFNAAIVIDTHHVLAELDQIAPVLSLAAAEVRGEGPILPFEEVIKL